ncbi:MFS transporter [Streptomyces sulfonofaciens]|uniref:MFS transporter n=1 Tax=Streptomyces sulfonofaciens TaxID=68272 RepID=A0A919GMC3_9ACTN|nr:MFS transporter [Streptomyces sulfonofaciens]GHH87470.1 MFS transporter [Streptomyces sulfonofaciens]
MTEHAPPAGSLDPDGPDGRDGQRGVAPPSALLRRARAAVFLLFFVNALAYANIVPRLPEIRDHIGLSNTALGTAIAAMPVGALLAGLLAGPLGARIGSGRLATLCAFGFALAVPLVSFASAWWMLAGCLFLLGVLDSVMDASMNTHGLRVQRGYGRSILNSFHALWSVGAVVGGLLSTALTGAGAPLTGHLVGIGVLLAVLGAAVWPMLLPGGDDSGADGTAPAAAPEDAPAPAEPSGAASRAGMRAALPLLLMLGLLLVMSSVVEDTPASWGSALLQDDYRASELVAGFAYVAFQATMTVGRFTGDRITDRFGRVAVARVGGVLIALPLALALLTHTAAAVIAAFACAGLGAATLFPAAMHAAGSIPGVRSSDGIAVVSWLARVGFLAAPPVVGLIGDHVDLRAGVAVVVVAGLLILALAKVMAPADRDLGHARG